MGGDNTDMYEGKRGWGGRMKEDGLRAGVGWGDEETGMESGRENRDRKGP